VDECKSLAHGSVGFAYPCETGDRAYGQATMSFKKPDVTDVSDIDMKVSYACGDIASDQPRWTVTGSTSIGIAVGSVTLNPLKFSVFAFDGAGGGDGDGEPQTEFTGIISGVVDVDTGSTASPGAEVGFAFDTRDKSWSATTGLGFESDNINATLQMQSSSGCSHKGTSGAGALSVRFFGGSTAEGTASVLKRCGEYAAKDGAYALRAALSTAVMRVTEGVSITLFDVSVSMDSEPSSAQQQDSLSMLSIDWTGRMTAGASLSAAGSGSSSSSRSSSSSDEGLMASLTLSANMTFAVASGEVKFGTLALRGDFAYACSNNALVLSGSVNLAVPCQPSNENETGTNMVEGEVRVNVRSGSVVIAGARAALTYGCGTGAVKVFGSVASVAVGPVNLTGVKFNFIFADARMSDFTGAIAGTVDVTSLSVGGFVSSDGPAATTTPESSVTLSRTAADGFQVGKLIVNLGIALRGEVDGGGGGSGESRNQSWALNGTLRFVHPCGAGETISGAVTLNAHVDGSLVGRRRLTLDIIKTRVESAYGFSA